MEEGKGTGRWEQTTECLAAPVDKYTKQAALKGSEMDAIDKRLTSWLTPQTGIVLVSKSISRH